MTLRGTAYFGTTFTNQPSTGSASSVTETVLPGGAQTYSYTYGTGAGEVDTIWSQGSPGNAYTITTSANLNLTSLTTTTGGTANFARVKTIYIANNDPTNVLTVGGAGSDPWTGAFTGTITINPGEVFQKQVSPNDATGWVTSGTSFNLKLAATSASVTIVLTGCSI